MTDLEFIQIVDQSYPWHPPAQDRESLAIDLSNSNYDPDLGQDVLESVAFNTRLAEDLGFDGALVFEQHGHPLALVGNSLTGAAWLAGQTTNINICAVGPMVNNYQSPVRLAEEVAMIDTASRGRLILGLPIGIGAQYHAIGTANPAHARDRYAEALALLDRIWNEDGPFAWEGEYFHIPNVNIWPRPRKAPRVLIPTSGSREALTTAAKYRFTYMAVLVPGPILTRNIQTFRDLCNEQGYEAAPNQVASVISVYIGESEKAIKRELERHSHWHSQVVVRYPDHESFPPGHSTMNSLRGMLAGGYRSKGNDPSKRAWDAGVVMGTPERVREILEERVSELGIGTIIMNAGFTLPRWLNHKQMQIFAEEVMPHFRPEGKPTWAREPKPGWTSASERVGRKPHYGGIPMVDVPGRGRLPLYEMDDIDQVS